MTKPMHAVWVWRRWTRWRLTPSILVLAATVIALDVITAWRDVSITSLGRVAVSPALPIGIILAFMVGLRRLGLDRANLWAWREFLSATGAVLVYGIWSYSENIGGFEEAIGLVLGALDEELVYRLAVLIVVGAGTAALLRRNWRNPEDWGLGPGIVAILASGIVFMLLPGHVAQMSSATRALPFAALGIILAYVVLRTGGLLPAVVTHALLNLITIAALTGNVSDGRRAAFAAALLVTLILATIVAGVRLGMLKRIHVESGWRYHSYKEHSKSESRSSS
jgi:membrane protease YdiL (CAAX protease family)